MDIRKLQRAIVDGLEDVKAQDIVVFNTEALSPLFERVIIASGTSNRQTKALASSVRETVKSRGLPLLRTEGEENGEWIIVDCGQAVVHIMQPAIRQYYHLEEIWGGKSIRLKKAAVTAKGLVKASEPMDDDEEEVVETQPAATRKPRASSASAGASGAGKAPAKPRASRAPKGESGSGPVPARKPAARKPAAAKVSTAGESSSPRAAAPRAKATAGSSPARSTAARSKSAGDAKPAGSARPRARKPAAG
jgi:ribosome-associated protein